MKPIFPPAAGIVALFFSPTIFPGMLTAQNVGINTTAPGAMLHVVTGSSGYAGGYFPGAIVEGSGNTYLNLLTPASAEGALVFGRPGDAAHGGVVYNNTGTPNGLQFRTNGNQVRMVISQAGSVGIGTTSPGFPLNFAPVLGDKISLWGSGGAHYGFGVQSGLLQVHSDGSVSDIAFGYGSSAAFTENLRIKGTGILQFPAALSKKIVLYPGGTGDAGFSVFGNELRIASDYSGADITFGYDHRVSGFTEKFRMKASGPLVVNGNQGQAGQVLTSSGPGSPAWGSATNTLYHNTAALVDANSITLTTDLGTVALPGMTYNFSIAGNAKLFLSYSIPVSTIACAFCSSTAVYIDVNINGNRNSRNHWDIDNGVHQTLSWSKVISLGAGNYSVQLLGRSIGPSTIFNPCCVYEKVMNVQVIPE